MKEAETKRESEYDDDSDGEWDSDDEMVTEDELAYERRERRPKNGRRNIPSTRFFSLAKLDAKNGVADEEKRHSSPNYPRRHLMLESLYDEEEDEGSTLDQQLKALFFTIKLYGVSACRDSQLQIKGAKIEAEIRDRGAEMTELELVQRFNGVVDEAISLEKARRKGIHIGWSNEVALERFKALDALKRKQLVSASETKIDADDFILMADLAACLKENGVKIDMNEVREIWELLALDCNSPDPLKLTFAQFYDWLYKWHPQLQGAKKIILASFVSTDAFIREFKFHSVVIDRLIQARHKKKQEAQAKQYSLKIFDSGLSCLCNFSPCKSVWTYLETQTTSQLARAPTTPSSQTSSSRLHHPNTATKDTPSRYLEYC